MPQIRRWLYDRRQKARRVSEACVRNFVFVNLLITIQYTAHCLAFLPVLAVMMCARNFLFFNVCLSLSAFTAPTQGLPACSTDVSVQPCACHEGTTFQNSTTVGIIGASIFDARTILYSCKPTPVHKSRRWDNGQQSGSRLIDWQADNPNSVFNTSYLGVLPINTTGKDDRVGSTRTLPLGTEIFVEEVSNIRAAARVGMASKHVDEWMIKRFFISNLTMMDLSSSRAVRKMVVIPALFLSVSMLGFNSYINKKLVPLIYNQSTGVQRYWGYWDNLYVKPINDRETSVYWQAYGCLNLYPGNTLSQYTLARLRLSYYD